MYELLDHSICFPPDRKLPEWAVCQISSTKLSSSDDHGPEVRMDESMDQSMDQSTQAEEIKSSTEMQGSLKTLGQKRKVAKASGYDFYVKKEVFDYDAEFKIAFDTRSSQTMLEFATQAYHNLVKAVEAEHRLTEDEVNSGIEILRQSKYDKVLKFSSVSNVSNNVRNKAKQQAMSIIAATLGTRKLRS